MMKISIKREQSQAGLSFAEREKFRPQVKNKLLLLLALLLTAATGAWAQDAKHLITATYREQTRSLEQPLPYATTIGELYEAVTGVQSFSDLISSMSAVEMPLTGITSRNTSVVSIGELNGASTPVTVIADGEATISIKFGSYAHGIFVSATSPLYAYMKDGVKDADKWTVKVGEGLAQALPIGGLKGDGSETVTLQYTGRLKVKGVKATSDAAAASVPVETITLNKTETSIKVGATETLSVTSVLPEEATDKTYTWKTSDESKATVDQNGKVTAVAAGTVTIYAEANDGSGVKGNCAVTVTPATITVTINQSDWGSGWNPSFTKDGVTVSASMIDPHDGNLMDGGTFSTTLGNFTKIVVTATDCDASGTGWSGSSSSMTWAGTPASTVSFSGDFMGLGMTETTIVCTIVPAN